MKLTTHLLVSKRIDPGSILFGEQMHLALQCDTYVYTMRWAPRYLTEL